MAIELLRPDDLLFLHIDPINLRLDTSDPQSPHLTVDDPQRPAYLVVRFPPQSIAEEAFFDSTPPPTSPQGPKGVDPQTQKRIDQDNTTGLPAPKPPGQAKARMSGPSRLVFRVPPELLIPYSIEGLLDWSKLELMVSPIAAAGGGQRPSGNAARIRPPEALETTLELPYRLHLSPRSDVRWQHSLKSVNHGGWSELWHTRLGALDRSLTVGLRAIWSPDYREPIPPPGDFGPLGALGAMSPYDRAQIVILSSDFTGYAKNAFQAYTPTPIQASQLMLSSLGGWLRSVGTWDPPYKIKPRFRIPRVQLDKLLIPQVFHLDELGQQTQVAADLQDRALVNPGLQAKALAPGLLEQMVGFRPLYDLGTQLDLSQWAHIATQGRDHYVRIVYEGRLKWSGHRAALIKVSERRIETGPQGAPVAYLRQYMYLVVREPEKDYGSEGLAFEGRGMVLKKVRLTTVVTPKIDYPYTAPSAITDRSFWVRVGKTDFQFNAVGEDLEGNRVDFSTPLIFVPNSEMNNPANLSLINSEFNKAANSARRQARVPGQKLAFAASEGNDNTRLVTQTLNFINESADAIGFFKPRLFKAEVRIPAVEQVVGSGTVSTLRLHQQYLEKGFGDATNLNKVFAELVQENASGVLEKAQTAVRFAAEQAGGFATPNLDITNLSRKLGPLGGEVADALKDKFNPEQFFPKGLAKIFGSFDLADLIPKNKSTDKNAPKMQIRREGSTVIAELDWKPEVKTIDLVIIKFTPTPNKTEFVVHGVFKKDLLAPSPQSMTLEGKLNDFNLELLKVVRVNLDKFTFKAESGKKTDVHVSLNDALPVEFLGDLEFVEGLRKIIPPGVFGDGVSIDLIKKPLGIKAGISVGLPPAAVGVFALQNISLSAGLTIPFLEGKPIFNFAFARRDNPFMLTIAFLGGGGFFGIELDTEGIRKLEASFEFGASAAINLGVASGEVHIMAGIYFKMEKKMQPAPISKEVNVSLLTGYLRMGGKLSVLGIISVSVEFCLSFTYDGGTQKASGRATLTITIEIAFFSKSVELSVEKSFGAKGGDPTFAQLVDTPAVWAEYVAAFA